MTTKVVLAYEFEGHAAETAAEFDDATARMLLREGRARAWDDETPQQKAAAKRRAKAAENNAGDTPPADDDTTEEN